MSRRLETGVALVTGAAGGIGGAVCRALIDKGYTVAAADKVDPENELSEAAMKCRVDLADEVARDELVGTVEAALGLPDVLVNAAGVYRAVDFPDLDARYMDEVFAVNVRAPMSLCGELARRHIASATPASVVNIASVSGQIGSPDAAYGASKGALLAFTRGAGRALARHGIRVNAVAPGIVDTAMARSIPPSRLATYLEEIPLRRLCTTDEVARVVAFLAGPDCSYITGTVVDVNGGLA